MGSSPGGCRKPGRWRLARVAPGGHADQCCERKKSKTNAIHGSLPGSRRAALGWRVHLEGRPRCPLVCDLALRLRSPTCSRFVIGAAAGGRRFHQIPSASGCAVNVQQTSISSAVEGDGAWAREPWKNGATAEGPVNSLVTQIAGSCKWKALLRRRNRSIRLTVA